MASSRALAIFSAHPHSPAGHQAQSTLLLLLDYHTLFLTISGLGTSAPFIWTASQLKSWAQSQGIAVAHALIDPNLSIPTHAKDPDRLTTFAATAQADPAAMLEPEPIRGGGEGDNDKERVFKRAPGYVSALSSPGLLDHLKAHGITSLILAGISTSGCVLRTAVDASERGFVVTVVSDACADPADGVHDVMVSQVLPVQAHVADLNTLRTEWERVKHT